MGTWYRGASFGGGGWHDEYDRWWLMAQLASQHLAHQSVVHIMDREADDYWLLHNLTSNGERFIVRGRASGERTRLLVDDDYRQLHEAVASLDAEVERDVKLSKRRKKGSEVHDGIHPPRESRMTHLCIAARTQKLKRPKRHPKQSKARRAATLAPALQVNVVRVWEPEPPTGEKPVEWVLLTSDPIDTTDQILQVVAPIARTLLHLRSEARRMPDAPAELVLCKSQIEVLRTMGRVPLPHAPRRVTRRRGARRTHQMER